ncbi:MAG: sulfotransferase family protein [Janthinobacterium lividum]
MKVLALGLPRCATSSLQAALESPSIGFAPAMHMAHIVPSAHRERLVIAAMIEPDRERRHKILHEIFDGYAATADFPGMVFVTDLMDMYPDASIVLNTRASAAAWSKSIKEALSFFGSKRYLYTAYLIQTDRLHYQIHQEAYKKMARDIDLSPEDIFSPKHYERHNQSVRDEAKKRGRPVLEYRPEDGWKPLCEFLDVQIPSDDIKYPWLNDAATMTTLKMILVARGLISWAALGGVLYAGWYWGRRLT